jgi:helicase MOV-10
MRTGGGKFKLQTKTNPNFKKRYPQDRDGSLEGERPPSLLTYFDSPVPMYSMPVEFLKLCSQDVYTMQKRVLKLLTEDKGLVPKTLTPTNFCDYQHAVLFTEELQMKYDISLYDLEVSEKLSISRGLHKIVVGSGLAEKRPSVLKGDAVLLQCKQGKFVGYVHNVLLETIEVSFHQKFANTPPFTVHFDFQRTPLRTMHRAVDELSESLVSNDAIALPEPASHAHLNNEQRLFLSAALKVSKDGKRLVPPLFLWGPPGTGKTTTVVHTVIAILKKQASAKVLLTAPSNPAADLLCERLGALGVNAKDMLRLVAVTRDPRHVSQAARKFTRMDAMGMYFTVPPIEELQKQRVVVATCTCRLHQEHP